MDATAARAIFRTDDVAFADGEIAWSWHPWAGAKAARWWSRSRRWL